MRPTVWILVGLLLGVFAGAPTRSTAATISGVVVTKCCGNTADSIDNVTPVVSAVQSTASLIASTSTSLDARYAAVVSADRGGSGGSGTTNQNFNGHFTITFQLTETASTPWSLIVDVLQIGAQTIVSDGGGNATVALGDLIGQETGAGSITSGSLSLAALSDLSNASAEATSPDVAFNQATNAILSGIGTGAAQTVILDFVFNARATTVDPPAGTVDGDEAALRMGLDSALSAFTADDYPGADLRDINADGIWVSLVVVPEPGTALLLGLGLLGLGRHRRARRH